MACIRDPYGWSWGFGTGLWCRALRWLVLILNLLASAVLLVLALPPVGLHYLAWFALVPALAAAQGRGFGRGFAIGLGMLGVAALVSRSGLFFHPSLLNGESGWNYASFGIFGVAVGLTFGVWGQTGSASTCRPWILAAWSVLFESLLLLYLPGHLALTQARVPTMLAVASVTGIWGVSYLLWLSNIAIAKAWATGRMRSLAVPAGILVTAIAAGYFLWTPETGELGVGAIQTSAHDRATFERLNAEAGRRGGSLTVWPEGSADALAPAGDTTGLLALAAGPGQPAFVAGFEDGHLPLPYNCASLFTSQGESARYAKRRPFGSERSAHTPGRYAVSVPFLGSRVGFGVCFDSCYPRTMRQAARLPGVGLIALPTKDPVAPYGTVQAFHAAYTSFRAAETGVPIIRADTSAYSEIVDGRGFILAEGRSGVEEVVTARIEPGRHWTFYGVAGDWFLYLCGAVAAVDLIRRANRRSPSH